MNVLTISPELKSTVSHLTGLPKAKPDPAHLHVRRRVEHTLLESWQRTKREVGNQLLENGVSSQSGSHTREAISCSGRSMVEYRRAEVQLPPLPFFLFPFISFPWKYKMWAINILLPVGLATHAPEVNVRIW